MDTLRLRIFNDLDGKANVYTMDHRGVGQGTQLECKTPESAGSGSSNKSGLQPAQVPACAKELEEKFGDLAAFSTTSAAMDVVSFIADHGSDYTTVIYGMNYGSLLLERIMHLNPPEVTGYVFDRPTTNSGAPLDDFTYVTSLDAGFGETADTFLDLCAEDRECSARFKKKGLKASLRYLMAKLDKNPHSKCSKLVNSLQIGDKSDPPSFALRFLLGMLLQDVSTRTLIAPIIHRLLRCAKKDVDVLTYYVKTINDSINQADEPASEWNVLHDLIVSSELWESPTPSVAQLKARLKSSSMSDLQTYEGVAQYCAFSKKKSPACNKLKLGNYRGNGIVYERDEYWNKAVQIPDQARVLVISSEMEPRAPSTYAKSFLEALDGDKKELVTFKYFVQNNYVVGDVTGAACGAKMIASFVQNDGNLEKLDKACVEEEAAMNWTTPRSFYNFYLGTDDVYDGGFDATVIPPAA